MWVAGIFLQESYYGYGIAYTITAAISMRYFIGLICLLFFWEDFIVKCHDCCSEFLYMLYSLENKKLNLQYQ